MGWFPEEHFTAGGGWAAASPPVCAAGAAGAGQPVNANALTATLAVSAPRKNWRREK
ncbi:MAG: hypothetical protein HC802_18050 [Caldilineaceae bacterium]|nr:hypothetical protein [Caldilineaceae bacterium]